MIRKHFIALCLLLVCSSFCLAQEKVVVPGVVDKELVGEWKVVMMGQDGKLEPMPADRHIRFVFNADGKGAQFKDGRKRIIIWGADKNGVFAAQWDHPEGNGDAIAGQWAITADGLELDVADYGDGQGPPDDQFTLLLKRVER